MKTTGAYSRTVKGLRNSVVALAFQVVALLIGFFTRKIFLEYLGTEILGLNSTAQSLVGFLNIAELGIGAAVASTLFKPLFDKDKEAVKEIVALEGWMFKRVAMAIIAGALVLMPFFPRIFTKMELPMWYAYASFGVFLYSSMLGYFVNYKQIILNADQNEYRIQFSYRTFMILKQIVGALLVKYLDNGFVWWLITEVTASTVAAWSLARTVNRSYPFMKEKVANPGALRTKYPGVISKVKQMFFHKVTGFVVNQLSPVIIYAFASLTVVALYGNYQIITVNLGYLLTAVFTSMGASVGSVVAQGDKPFIFKIFRELFTVRFCIIWVCSFCIWTLAEPFIKVWIGAEYLLDGSTLIILTALFFLTSVRSVVDSFINAYGLFQDIWSPIVEAVINLSSAIVLGSKFGLNGVLMGSVISTVLVIMIWKPIFLFHWGMHEPVKRYFNIFIKHLALGAVAWAGSFLILRMIPLHPEAGIPQFLLAGIVYVLVMGLVSFALLYAAEPGMRTFVDRMFHLRKRLAE